MARGLSGALVVVGSLACAGVLDIAAPFEPYLQGILDREGLAATTLEACESFGSSRKGRCWVAGPPAELEVLVDRLDGGPASTPDQGFGQTCLEDPAWGQGGVAHQGVTVRELGANYPPNQQNILPERAYLNADGTRACIELSFPFG